MNKLSKNIEGIPRLLCFFLFIILLIGLVVYVFESNKEYSVISVISKTCPMQVTTNYQYTHSGECTGEWSAWYLASDGQEERVMHGFRSITDTSYTRVTTEYWEKGTCDTESIMRISRDVIKGKPKGSVTTGVAYSCVQKETRRINGSSLPEGSPQGCTDNRAVNYDARSTADDGSCWLCEAGSIAREGGKCIKYCPAGYTMNSSQTCELDF